MTICAKITYFLLISIVKNNCLLSNTLTMMRFLSCCAYGEFTHDRPVGPAIWPHFDLFTLHSGKLWLTIADQSGFEMDAGSVLLIYPHTHFMGNTLTDVSRASVCHFAVDDQADHVPEVVRNKADGYIIYPNVLTDDLAHDIDRTMRLAQQRQTHHVKQMRESLMLMILSQLAEREAKRPVETMAQPLLGQTVRWARERLHESISVDDMAAQANLSTSHFRTVFREQSGQSPLDALTELRMNEAARMLRETAMPIRAIAKSVGYPEVPNFYRVFRQRLKMPPAKYRSQNQPKG